MVRINPTDMVINERLLFLLFLAAGIALGGWYVASVESEKRKIKSFLNSEMEIAEIKPKERKITETILRAGMAGQEANLVLAILAASIGAYVFGYSLTGNPKLAVMFAFLGPFLVWQYLQYKIDKNEWLMYTQVGDMCKLMANAMKAGMSIERALPRIAEKLEAPLKNYVVDIERAIARGNPVVDVLKDYQKYIRVTPYLLFVRATAISRKQGGDLAEAYADIFNVVTKSINAIKKVRVVNNSAVRRGAIVTIIPVGMVMFLRGFSPDYIEPLFTTFPGYICLGIVGILVAGAWIMIKKLSKLELV